MSIADTYHRIGVKPSTAQLALAKVILGEPLADAELTAVREYAGMTDWPCARFEEATVICGRKSGKTEYVASPLAVHIAAVESHEEPGVVLLFAPSKSDQAMLGWQAINRQLQRGFPDLISDIKESEGRILLHNGNEIRVASANFRTLRGPKYLACIGDEACFHFADSPEEGGSQPLEFILDSISGGMVATAHPLLLLISSPWTKHGVVFEQYDSRATNADRLVWKAPTLAMNPYANQALMEKHRRDRGENFYRREYLAEFSEDTFAYIEAADVDAAISTGCPFIGPKPGNRYAMGLDPGRKKDHFGAAVAHKERDGVVVVDWCREWKPGFLGLKYADVLPAIWERAREFRIRKIASDQVDFGGIEASIPLRGSSPEFEMERVMTGGTSGAEIADVTRGLFASRKLVLPDQPGLADEFKRLSDYLTQGGGRDIRAKRGHDDRSRAIMLAVYQAFSQPTLAEPWALTMSVKDPFDDFDNPRMWQRLQ